MRNSLHVLLDVPGREIVPHICVSPFDPHVVILHRDERHNNQLDYVAAILSRVVGVLPLQEARNVVTTAFTLGEAIVIECPMETAEHYQERLASFRLTISVRSK